MVVSVRRECGITPYAKTISLGLKEDVICCRKTIVFITIKVIVTKGNVREGLSSLNGIISDLAFQEAGRGYVSLTKTMH